MRKFLFGIVFLSGFAFAGPPPYHVNDPATQGDFEEIFRLHADHTHDNDGSVRLDEFNYSVAFKGPHPWRDIRAYGALCDGSTDDTAAVQATHDAASAGEAIFIPPSALGCVVNSTVTITKQISFFGASSHGSLLISSTDRVMFDINTNAADLYYIKFRSLELVNGSSGTISAGIQISGSNGLKYGRFEDLSIRGFVYAVSIVNTGSTDWTWFDGLDIHGEPGSPAKEGIHRSAIGTGMIINNSVIITENYGVFVQGSNFGDYVISGNQFFQNSTSAFCIYLEALAPFDYHDNITITGNHFDGNTTNEYIKMVHIRASKIQGNTMSGRSIPINEDATSTDNVIQVGFGVGEQWDQKIIINDTPTTNRSGFGIITPQTRFHVVPADGADYGIAIGNSISKTSATSLSGINNTASANAPVEYRASSHSFTTGPIVFESNSQPYLKFETTISSPTVNSNFGNIWTNTSSGVAEVKVMDGAGNITQISPHDENGDWIFYSENAKTGKKLYVNMEKFIRKMEYISGETFIFGESQ